MLSEKGLCSIIKSSYKSKGYDYIPRKSEILLFGRSWAVRAPATELPQKAAALIVEQVGYLPTDAMNISKAEDNQGLMDSIVSERENLLLCEELEAMQAIPIIFKERWQLYQTEGGAVYGFDTELLGVLDSKTATVRAFMDSNGMLGVFCATDIMAYIAPGRFSAADSERIAHIAGMDWMQQTPIGDPVANMSLFDSGEDAPIPERAE